jgi:competence protein ComEA
MRNSEFLRKLKRAFSCFNPNSAIPACRQAGALRIPHFSMGQQKVLFVLALLILALLYFKFYFHSPSLPEETYKEVVVEILGEVRKPGIYIFKNSATLTEAVEKAGGLNEPARFDEAQSKELLETGTSLNISKKSQGEVKIGLRRIEATKLLAFSIPLDLNRVSVKDLCLVPGIGESLAKEIVSYRERRKGFRSVEELKNVRGIGEKKWKDLAEFLMVKK